MPPERLAPEELPAAVRSIRAAYDRLSPGDRAALRRCRDADDILLEGAFWQLVRSVRGEQRARLGHVVACFPAAEAARPTPTPFRFGAFLRGALHPGKKVLKPQDAIRFRQLVQARDREELVHHLRRLLRLASRRVEWGVLGRDIYLWGDHVRRRWVQDFYAPIQEERNG